MKNLKKILLALALVALLVSSVVTIAIAEASYTGNVKKAEELLDAAIAATDSDNAAGAKKEPLGALYNYLLTVNPNESGYDKVKDAYNIMTFKVAHTLYDKVAASATADAKSAALAEVYVYMASAPVILKSGDADVTYSHEYICNNCGMSAEFISEQQFLNGLTDLLGCPGICSDSAKKLAYVTEADKVYSYAEFEKEVNKESLSIAGNLIACLFGMAEATSGTADYYDVITAQKAYLDYLKNIPEIEYSPAESQLYTGDIAEVKVLISGINTNSATFDELRSTLGAVYTYLTETPVVPTSDDYHSFINKYSELCDALILGFEEEIDSCASPADKLAALQAFRAYLTETQISEKVVGAFNDIRAEVIDEYRNADAALGEFSEIDVTVAPLVYENDMSAFKSKLEEAETLGVNGDGIEELLASIYNDYVSEFAYNPLAEEYENLISNYKKLSVDYVKKAYIDELDKKKSIKDKYDVLAEFNSFINEAPLCEAVTDMYNSAFRSLLADAKAVCDAIGETALDEYVASQKNDVTSPYVLNSFLSELKDSYQKYIDSEGEQKDAAFEDMLSASAAIRTYTMGSGINPDNEDYSEIVAEYNEVRANVVTAILSTVDNAEDKTAALLSVRDYLAKTPLTKEAVVSYNEKVVECITDDEDKKDALLLDNVYLTIDALVETITDEEATNESILSNGLVLASYDKLHYDVTDPAYKTYLSGRESAYTKVSEALYESVVFELNNSDDVEAVIDGYSDYVKSAYHEKTVEAFAKALSDTELDLAEIIADVEDETGGALEYYSIFDFMFESIEAYYLAGSLEERLQAFEAVYYNTNEIFFTTELMIGESYSEYKSEYAKVLSMLEYELISLLSSESFDSMIEAFDTVSTFISNITFSNTVIQKYNEELLSASELGFGEYADEIEQECEILEYSTPENWYPHLSRILLALEESVVGGEVNSEKFAVAYKILGGYAGVNGPKVIDFGVVNFVSAINRYNEIKNAIVKAYKDKFAGAVAVSEKYNVLSELGEFIENYPFSYELVIIYEEMRTNLAGEYVNASGEKLDSMNAVAQKIKSHLAKCPVNVGLLDAAGISRYNTIESLIEAINYSVVNDLIYELDTLPDDNLAIHQNLIADKINSFVNNSKLGAFSDSILVSSAVRFAFEGFIEKMNSELSEMSDEDRSRKIASVGAYLVQNNFSYEIIEMYNAQYKTSLVANSVQPGAEVGSVIEFGKKISSVDMSLGADDIRLALTGVVEYVNSHTFSAENVQLKTLNEINALNEQIEKDTEKRIQKLDSLTKIDEYGYPVLLSYDHENSKLVKTGMYNGGKISVASEPLTNNKYAHVVPNANSYFTADLADGADTRGLVIEMDIMSDDLLNFRFYFYEDGIKSGTRVGLYLFEFKDGQLLYDVGGNGDYNPNYLSGTNEPIVAVPGQWMHFTIELDVQSRMMEIFVDYVSLGEKPMKVGNNDWCNFTELHFTFTKANSTVNYDNFVIYSGTSCRTLDRLSTTTPEQQFNAYVETALDDTIAETSRVIAYYQAAALRDSVGDASNEYKAMFDAFDFSSVIERAQSLHLDKLEEFTRSINVNAMTTANSESAAFSISSAENYIAANRQYIDQSSDRFKAINSLIVSAKAKAVWLENLSEFESALTKFHRATTNASLAKHFETVMKYYDLCKLDESANMTAAEKDPAIVAFVALVNRDSDVTSSVGSATLGTYLADYIPYRVSRQLYYENSLKILTCIEFIESLLPSKEEFETDSAYYAALADKVMENSSFAGPYLAVIREIARDGAYDVTVDGVEDAISVFEIIDEDYYQVILAEHFKVIKAQLEKYAMTSSFIEKSGICAFVESYIAENNVDLSSTEGRQYAYALGVYKAELISYKEAYEEILASNTEAFIGLVKKMESYVTYTELKPLYEEAINNYYYSMNVDSDEAKAAVEKFAVYQKMIEDWESNSAMFIGYVNTLKSQRRQSQKFRTLVNCADYADKVDTGIAGVSEALATYNQELAAYNAGIEPARAEISEMSDVVSALRTKSISATVLAIIQNIISK